jgi:hypothetical protein
MSVDAFAIYLELCILWHKDIRDNSFNDFDRKWKQGQIDLLQSMVNEIDGVIEPSVLDTILLMMEEMGEE